MRLTGRKRGSKGSHKVQKNTLKRFTVTTRRDALPEVSERECCPKIGLLAAASMTQSFTVSRLAVDWWPGWHS